MKKLTALFLSLVLMLACFSVPASATSAQFANTKQFLKILDDVNLTYTVVGLDDDGDEKVTLDNKGDNWSYMFRFFFSEDNTKCSIRVWNLLDFAEENFVDVLLACNQMNYDYKFTTWYVDYTDNSVTVSMDLILRESGENGDIVYEAARRMANIIDASYELLGQYAK